MRITKKMGKEVNSSFLKVPKLTIEKKPVFSNLINVLKPKVYITDSSKFMMLVQELTGNGNSSSFSSCTAISPLSGSSNGCSSNPVLIEPGVEKVVVAPVNHEMVQESCFSIDDLLSFDYLYDQTYSDTLEDSNPVWEADMMSFGVMSQADNLLLENHIPVMENEWSVYQIDLESSWLLETDQQPLQYQNGNNELRSMNGAQEHEVAAFNLEDICSWLL